MRPTVRIATLLALAMSCCPWTHAGDLQGACPTVSEPREYQARDETRCEGFKIRAFAAGAPAVVAVTVKPDLAAGSPPPAVLDIRVPVSTQPAGSLSPDPMSAVRGELVIRDYRYGYWADRFQMKKDGGYRTYGWPTELLSRFEVPLSQLHGRATDSRGRLVPVRLASASEPAPLHYELAIVSLSKLLRLSSFSICSDLNRACTKDNALFHEAGAPDSAFSPDLIVVRWNGLARDGKAVPAGLLRAEVRTLVAGEGAGRDAPADNGSVALFLHDPSLLR